ncbi:MAG: HAD family hydrolase [Patescibacteria group bacterium]
MKKVVLLDADGVVFKKSPEYFSERFCREYGAPREEVETFFKNEFKLCTRGKADLKEELAKRLPAWGWPKSVEEYLEWWFSNDTELDEEVLAVTKELQKQGTECYLASDQEVYRSEYIVQKLLGRLNGAWFACDLGYTKSQPEFFKEIIKRWERRYTPQEMWFWDDMQHNVDSARSVGINAFLFTSVEDLKQVLQLGRGF